MRIVFLMFVLFFSSMSAFANPFEVESSFEVANVMAKNLSTIESEGVAGCYAVSNQLDRRRAERGFPDSNEPKPSTVWKMASRKMPVTLTDQLTASEMPKVIERCERVFRVAFDCAVEQEQTRWEAFRVVMESGK